jgi:flavin-binding protein dodecin
VASSPPPAADIFPLESTAKGCKIEHPLVNDGSWRYSSIDRKGNPVSTYKIIELIGTSPTSWEEAVASAVETAGKSLRDLRIAEVADLDVQIQDGKVSAYRAKLKVSFKYKAD